MDIDSGDDLWGAGEYKSEGDDDSADSVDSTLASLGYSVGGGADTGRDFTESGTSLLKSGLFKAGVVFLGFLVALLLLVVLLG